MSLITGPGRYLTRDGEEVDVFRNDSSAYPWAYKAHTGFASEITVDGGGYQLQSGNPTASDIVAKAPEAASTKEEAPRLDDGGPAFPMPEPNIPAGHYYEGPGAHPGMTLRDYVAAKALQAIIPISKGTTRTEDAEEAYRYADAFLAARGRAA